MGPCADDIDGCPTETQLCPCNCDWMQAYEGFQEVEGAGPRICDVRIVFVVPYGGNCCQWRGMQVEVMDVLLVPAVDGVVSLFLPKTLFTPYNTVQCVFLAAGLYKEIKTFL